MSWAESVTTRAEPVRGMSIDASTAFTFHGVPVFLSPHVPYGRVFAIDMVVVNGMAGLVLLVRELSLLRPRLWSRYSLGVLEARRDRRLRGRR